MKLAISTAWDVEYVHKDDPISLTTLAVIRAASLRWAPMRFATRVEVAMASGNGMLNEVDVTVTRTPWAASCAVPN